MKYQIDEQGYWGAIEQTLQRIQVQRGSAATEGPTNLLAQVWDTGVPANAGEILQVLDARSRELAFDLLLGRSQHGRPTRHPDRNEIERLAAEVCRKLHAECKRTQ